MIKYVRIKHHLNEYGEVTGSWYNIGYDSGRHICRNSMPKSVREWIKARKFTRYECTYPIEYGIVYKVEFLRA